MDTNIHGDESQDLEMLEPLFSVVKRMLEKMEAMEAEIEALSRLVNDEIIGGITDLYNTKQKAAAVSSLSEKYGEMMSPYKDFYAELTDGADMYEKLYEDLEEFKQSNNGELPEDAEQARVQALVDELKARLDRIKEKLPVEAEPQAGAGEGKVIEVTVTSGSAEEPSKDALAELSNKIRAMKEKAGDVNLY